LFSCSDSKYKMYDMAFDKYVSIDDLIESGEYTAEICEKGIDRIFKTKPPILSINLSNQLNKLLSKWAVEEENFRRKQGDSTVYSHYYQNIAKVTKYVYTYILSEKPMHVFITCISSKKMQKTNCTIIYIRADHEGNIIGNYSDSSPVQNSCDKEIKCSELH
jgi:hypothetical protein